MSLVSTENKEGYLSQEGNDLYEHDIAACLQSALLIFQKVTKVNKIEPRETELF